MVLLQNLKFLHSFFLGQDKPRKMCSDVLERKLDFYFGQKFLYFLFLGNIGREKVFSDVLDRKLPFLDKKSVDFIKAQTLNFPIVSIVLVKNLKFLQHLFLAK